MENLNYMWDIPWKCDEKYCIRHEIVTSDEHCDKDLYANRPHGPSVSKISSTLINIDQF